MNRKFKELAEHVKKEMGDAIPISVLPDKSLVYKNYRIKKNKNGDYALKQLKGTDSIAEFSTKSAALLAAKFYSINNFSRFNQVLDLDSKYIFNRTDSEIFKIKMKQTKDTDRQDLFLWRCELAEQRASYYQHEILRMFKTYF